MKRPQSVDEYIASSGHWEKTLRLLRKLISSTALEETVKWGMPVYTLHGKNVVGFSAFKAWTGLWFYQGVFLKDPARKLINAQEGTTKGLRQMRFASIQEIEESREIILAYLKEAIQNQKEGKEIKPDRNKPLEMPPEFEHAFSRDPSLKESFETLPLSKKREFTEYVGEAKLEKTRQQRLEKVFPLIRKGTGLNEKYHN
jgi:uncharacterized protein YdeI (YjbR/CyaY-like superfamily)